MKKFFKILSVCFLLISTIFFGGCIFISSSLPNVYYSTKKSEMVLSGAVPLTIKPIRNTKPLRTNSNHNPSLHFPGSITLLNLIPIKTVEIDIIDESEVIPCGTPFGVKLFTEGVMVIGTSTIKTQQGMANPAKQSGIKKGDVITKINDYQIKSNEDLAYMVENSDGKPLSVSITRGNMSFDTSLTPAKSVNEDIYRVGIWVRDSSAGIGTITFYNAKNKSFSGLGHGICDVDTGELLPLSHGDIMEASINGINRGTRGTPGELKGYFVNHKPIGKLKANTETGIYGTLDKVPNNLTKMKIAMKHQVKTGPAYIITTLKDETPQKYTINIESINYQESNPTKNILISITDKELLSKTGGIVQGMSGSPIIQNGMLIGAVTHVFINEPNKGFAIFAETMLTNSNNFFNITNQTAS